MTIYTATFTHIYDCVYDYKPRTAVFSSREKAESFINEIMSMHKKSGQNYLVATIDSDELDSENYYDFFKCEFFADDE